MKKTLLVAVMSLFVFINSAQATILEIYDFTGSFDASGIGSLQNYVIRSGNDSPVSLGTFYLNKYEKIQPCNTSRLWIEMMQRTYAPAEIDKSGDGNLAEHWSMYNANRQWGTIEWDGTIEFVNTDYTIGPIPDLSAYTINDLYVDNLTRQIGSIVDYDIRLLADVTPAPVPEPSTFILLAIGVAGVGFLRRKAGNKILIHN